MLMKKKNSIKNIFFYSIHCSFLECFPLVEPTLLVIIYLYWLNSKEH